MKKVYILLFFSILIFLTNPLSSQSWLPMGPDNLNQLSTSYADFPQLKINPVDGLVYAAYKNWMYGAGKLTVRKYTNAGIWETVDETGVSDESVWGLDFTISNAGILYVVYNEPSDYLPPNSLTVKKFNGTSWELVGTRGFSGEYYNDPKIVVNSAGVPYVCSYNSDNGIFVWKWNETTWEIVGGAAVAAYGTSADLNIDLSGVPYVAYTEPAFGWKGTVKKFVSGSWSVLGGSAFTPGMAFNFSINFDSYGNPFVAYADYSESYNGSTSVEKFQSSSWQLVGTRGFSSISATSLNLILPDGSTPYVLVQDVSSTDNVHLFSLSGPTWAQVGSQSLSIGQVSTARLEFNSTGTPFISINDAGADSRAYVKSFDGSNWNILGPEGFTPGLTVFSDMAFDPAGVPYLVYQDDANSNKASVMKYNVASKTWSQVGNAGFSAGTADYPSIAIDASGSPYVVYCDRANSNKATVMKYSAGSWSAVGSAGFTTGAAEFTDIAINSAGIPYIAFMDGNNSNKLSVLKYSGGSWVTDGSSTGISAGAASYIKIGFKSNDFPYVVCRNDGASGRPYMYYKTYHPTAWYNEQIHVYTANSLSMAIDVNDNIYIAFVDEGNDYGITVRKNSGSSWNTLGSNGFTAQASYPSISVDAAGTPYLAYKSAYTLPYKLNVKKYNGSSWVDAIGTGGISNGPADYVALAVDGGTPYVVFEDMKEWGFNAGYTSLFTQTYSVSFSNVLSDRATLSWSNGNGGKRAVFMKQTSRGSAVPANGSSYSASTIFGQGTQIGSTGWFCVYNGTGTTVNVTGLTPGATYRAYACEYNDATDAGTEYLTTTALDNPKSQQMQAEITWTGATSSDWSTAANWEPAYVPISTYNVTIPVVATVYPIVSNSMASPAICNNMTINNGAMVTIGAGKAFTVNGTLTNNTGIGGIIIQSTTDGTGSLLHSTTGVSGTINRYITGSTTITNYLYHLVSVPLVPENNSLSGLFLGAYLFDFNVAANTWHSLGTPTGNILDETLGYMIYTPATSATYTFEGVMNSGSFSPTVIHAGQGYNLVPNPYPSALDWLASGWTKTTIDNATYIWPSGGSNYAAFVDGVGTNGGTRYIPAGQAFFIKTNLASPVLTMNNAARVHNAQAFWKSGEETDNVLRIKALSNNYSDETVIRFNPQSTYEFDPEFDAAKMNGLPDAPQLFTKTDEASFSINSIPALESGKSIPVYFETEFTGTVNLNIEGIDSFDPSFELFLIDKITGQVINLRHQNQYEFSHDPANSPNRFELKSGNAYGVTENNSGDANIWISGNLLNISAPIHNGETAGVYIYNSSGQLIQNRTVTLSELTTLTIREKGLLIIKVSNDHISWISKGIINP